MPRGGRNSRTWPKGNGAGRGGPAKGAQQEPIVSGDPRQGARADNGDADEQKYRAGRRKRIRELRAFAENAQAEVIKKARDLGDLALQSQAADRLLARLPAEKLDEDTRASDGADAIVQIYLPERLPDPE